MDRVLRGWTVRTCCELAAYYAVGATRAPLASLKFKSEHCRLFCPKSLFEKQRRASRPAVVGGILPPGKIANHYCHSDFTGPWQLTITLAWKRGDRNAAFRRQRCSFPRCCRLKAAFLMCQVNMNCHILHHTDFPPGWKLRLHFSQDG